MPTLTQIQVEALTAHGIAAALAKQSELHARLTALDSVLVAFSGGADSAYLAWTAHRALGARALAVTALSASFSAYDREQAEAFVRHVGIRHEFIRTDELEDPRYAANNADRCYYCKAELFTQLERIAAVRGFAAIAYGLNADDTTDFRPGHFAAAEHQVIAPLLDVRLSKAEIRELSRQAGLPAWDRPASACLSSRVPYGTAVTPQVLAKIEAGEAALRALGFRQFRVRYYGAHARVEIDRAELARALEPQILQTIRARLAEAGFSSVTVDPEGYRQGSLNEALRR